MMSIPIVFEAAWVLVRLAAPNHRVHLCSGALLACRWRASSISLGMAPLFLLLEWNKSVIPYMKRMISVSRPLH